MASLHRHQPNPLVVFALAYIMFGSSVPFSKMGLESIPPLAFAAMKFGLGTLILVPWLIKKWHPLKPKQIVRIIIATFIGYVMTVILLYEGLKRTSGASVALIGTLGPLMLYVLSIEVLKERFNAKILFGLIISGAGAVLIIFTPSLYQEFSGLSLTGNLLATASIVASVIGTVIIKPVLRSVNPGMLTAVRMLTAAVFVLPLAAGELLRLDYSAVPLRSWIGLTNGLLVSIVLANILYHYGLSKISVESSSILHYLDPIIGVVASIIILGEQLSTVIIVGAGLIFWGIYVAEARLHPKFLFLHHHH